MKRFMLVAISFVFVIASLGICTLADAGSIIQFHDTSGWIDVASFDWLPGNALSNEALPLSNDPANPSTHNVFYQASLVRFIGPNGQPVLGTGLGTDYEITVVVAFKEAAFALGPSATFNFNIGGTNYAQIYYDTAKNADPLTGTGYSDGTLIMEGVMNAGFGSFYRSVLQGYQPLDQFGSMPVDNYPGIGAVFGIGSHFITTAVDTSTINPSYIRTNVDDILAFRMLTNTVDQPTFLQQQPSGSFWNGVGYLPPQVFTPVAGDPNFDSVNGEVPTDGNRYDFQTQADANTDFLVTPFVSQGGCRMTGGHNTFLADGTLAYVDGTYADTVNETQVTVKKGRNLQTVNQTTWYTLGGQIGAPQAGCTSDKKAFGEWEHVHHEGTVSWAAGSQTSPDLSWTGGTFSGGFAFHSGTASSPDESYIKCIICADPHWCTQARCAPFKQIFWEGYGVFDNIDQGTSFPNQCTVRTKGKNKPPTIHYYRAHVGDFGEPAGSSEQQKPASGCGWTSAGPSILNGVLDGVNIVPWPMDAKFGDKGGQDCSAYPGCEATNTCGGCPDWYEIEIWCKDTDPATDPTNFVIYKVANFITHGNHQIHPEVGQHCPF